MLRSNDISTHRHRFSRHGGCLALVLSTASVIGPASAGSDGTPSTACQVANLPNIETRSAGDPSPIRISRLLGSVVLGAHGKRVGTVNDVILNEDGRVVAVTLDIGAFLGVPTRTVAVPIGQLRLLSGRDAATRPARTPSSATDDDATTSVMQELMTGSSRASWPAGPGDHIEVNFTRRELADLPDYAGQ